MRFISTKRGQSMAIFLLLGLMLFFAIGFMVIVKQVVQDKHIDEISYRAAGASSFKEHMEDCLRYEALNAIDKYGVLEGQDVYLAAEVRRKLPGCIEWDFYEEQGYDIDAGTPAIDVQISEDAVLVDMTYLVSGTDSTGQFTIDELNFYLPRENTALLSFDGNDCTENEVAIVSTDGDAELVIPRGTTVTDSDGNPVEEIGVRMLERDFNDLDNPLAIGMVVYEVVPHVTFSKPVSLKVWYRQKDVPSTIVEKDIRLAQYDSTTGLWYSVPTEVDDTNNILEAKFTHFSPFTPVERCADGADYRIDFPVSQFGKYGYIFLQDCGDSDTCANIITDYEGNLIEDQEKGAAEVQLLPIREEEKEGEDTGFVSEENIYNQVPLSECTLDDWDQDDLIDAVEEIEVDAKPATCDVVSSLGEESVTSCKSAVSSWENKKEDLLALCNEHKWDGKNDDKPNYKLLLEAYNLEGNTADAIPDHETGGEVEVQGCTCTIKAEAVKNGTEVTGYEVKQDCKMETLATGPTYGYPAIEEIAAKELPGGFAIVRVRIAGNGGGCIATEGYEEDGKLRVEIDVVGQKGDTITVKINPFEGDITSNDVEEHGLVPGVAIPIDPHSGEPVEGHTPSAGDVAAMWTGFDGYGGTYDDDGNYEFYAGGTVYNDIYFKVEDTNADGCAWAKLNSLAIYGAGLAYDVPRDYTHCTVTVQERINWLCGCDRSCAEAGDWGNEVDILAKWRGEWNPAAGSIVNGKTLLCDLNPNDARLQGLMAQGWSPFGGACDEGDMVSVLVGGACSPEEVQSACDYTNNQVVECSPPPSCNTPAECATGQDCIDKVCISGTEASTNTWSVKTICEEGQVCKMVGEEAQCAGEITSIEMQPCSLDDDGMHEVDGRYFKVQNGICYWCCAGASTQWRATTLDPDSDPQCSTEITVLDLCKDGKGYERQCFDSICSSLGDGWRLDKGSSEECRNFPGDEGGDKCCKAPVEEETCEVSDEYPMAFCSGNLGECDKGLALSKSSLPENADVENREWVEGLGCDDGCCRVPIKTAEPGTLECPEGDYIESKLPTRCEEKGKGDSCYSDSVAQYCAESESGGWFRCYDTCSEGNKCIGGKCIEEVPIAQECAEIETLTDAGKTECNGHPECELMGGSCVPIDTECPPTAEGLPAGWLTQFYWDAAETECHQCQTDSDWHKVGDAYCSCKSPTTEVGEAAWVSGQCQRCDGLDTSENSIWTPVEINSENCHDKRCLVKELRKTPAVYISPGRAICLGETGTNDYKYVTCSLSGGEPTLTTHDCGMHCDKWIENTPKYFEDICACDGTCPDCLPAGLVQMYGVKGEYKLTNLGSCYYCKGYGEGNWDIVTASQGGCFCTDEGNGIDATTVGKFDWNTETHECWKCVTDTSRPQMTESYWTKEGVAGSSCGTSAMCTKHDDADVPEGGLFVNEYLCIAGPPESKVQRCLGGDDWANEQDCDWGCVEGQKIPPTGEEVEEEWKALAWCKPENH